MSEHFTPQPREDLTGDQDLATPELKHEQHEQEQSPVRYINYLCKTSSGEIVAVVTNPNVKDPISYGDYHDVYIGTEVGGLRKTKITESKRRRDGGTTNIARHAAIK